MRWVLLLFCIFPSSCTFQDNAAREPNDAASLPAGPWVNDESLRWNSPNSEFQALDVPEFLPAVVYAPSPRGAYPLIVAAHGAGGTPEWECDYWRRLSHGRAFLLCLRGLRTHNDRPSGYYYPTHLVLEKELRAALEAFRERFPEAPSQAGLYAGFSQGAIMGAAMIADHGDEFPYLALLEGGFDYWSLAKAQRFARAGGKRVLFICGTQWCADKAETPAAWLRQSNVGVRVEHAPGAGHTPSGGVMERTKAALPWLTEGDPVWQ